MYINRVDIDITIIYKKIKNHFSEDLGGWGGVGFSAPIMTGSFLACELKYPPSTEVNKSSK